MRSRCGPIDIHDSSSTLGIQVSYADRFHPQEVIPTSRITASLGLAQVDSHLLQEKIWIMISFDHVRMFF